ncbi:MAG: hypothetical protein HYU51_04330 [Candidatus Rokubacteria bacterium]|nr:hypothetical protein [Candidatus Rokubacteria bacterium]
MARLARRFGLAPAQLRLRNLIEPHEIRSDT